MNKARRLRVRSFFKGALRVLLNVVSIGLLRKPIAKRFGDNAADAAEAVSDAVKKEL